MVATAKIVRHVFFKQAAPWSSGPLTLVEVLLGFSSQREKVFSNLGYQFGDQIDPFSFSLAQLLEA